jgi:hypothetical protein
MFNGMARFYHCFIKIFASIMASIIKLLIKTKAFEWITKCQTTSEDINDQYKEAPIFISPNRESKCHVHTNASSN